MCIRGIVVNGINRRIAPEECTLKYDGIPYNLFAPPSVTCLQRIIKEKN